MGDSCGFRCQRHVRNMCRQMIAIKEVIPCGRCVKAIYMTSDSMPSDPGSELDESGQITIMTGSNKIRMGFITLPSLITSCRH